MLESLMLGLGLLGCGGAPMSQQIPVGRSRMYTRVIDTLGVGSAVRAPTDLVWSVLADAYADLGMHVNFREPAGRRLGVCYQQLRTRLGIHPLSSLVDCGETRSIPNADRYEVALTVLTTVQPEGNDASKVYTFVLGVALDASGASSNRVWCYSKAALEARLRERIEARLREAPSGPEEQRS